MDSHRHTRVPAPSHSGRMDDGLGKLRASGFKASDVLLLTCLFQNELTRSLNHQLPDSEL